MDHHFTHCVYIALTISLFCIFELIVCKSCVLHLAFPLSWSHNIFCASKTISCESIQVIIQDLALIYVGFEWDTLSFGHSITIRK